MRTERTVQDLDALADDLADVLNIIRATVKRMKTEGLESLLIHSETVTTRHLPALWEWAKRVQIESEMQVRAFRDGRESKAHIDKKRNQQVARNGQKR